MYRPFSCLVRRGAAVLAGATIALALPYASLAEDRDTGPAMATSEDPDDMTVGTEDPDSLVTGTEEAKRREVTCPRTWRSRSRWTRTW